MTNEPTVRPPVGYAQEVFWVGPQGGLVGLSTDAKPTTRPDVGTPLRPGLSFYETDTRRTYVFDGAAWREPATDWPTPRGDAAVWCVLAELREIRALLAFQAGQPAIFPPLSDPRVNG